MSMTKSYISRLQHQAAQGDKDAIRTLTEAGLWNDLEEDEYQAGDADFANFAESANGEDYDGDYLNYEDGYEC